MCSSAVLPQHCNACRSTSSLSSPYSLLPLLLLLLLLHKPPAAAVGKGWIEPGTLHLANLTGLQPSTTYWYRVVDLATGGTAATASEVASFTTPAPVGSTETLTFLVGADLGTGNNDDGSEQPQYNPSVGAYAVVQVGAKCSAAGQRPAALKPRHACLRQQQQGEGAAVGGSSSRSRLGSCGPMLQCTMLLCLFLLSSRA